MFVYYIYESTGLVVIRNYQSFPVYCSGESRWLVPGTYEED